MQEYFRKLSLRDQGGGRQGQHSGRSPMGHDKVSRIPLWRRKHLWQFTRVENGCLALRQLFPNNACHYMVNVEAVMKGSDP